MSTPTLTRAAELLELDAAELLLCHTTDGDWGDEHEAREAHDEMLAVAGELRAMIAAAPQPPAVHQGASPTAGMTLWQRIEHVGGRINAASYVEFGSVMAVDALISHVLRDLPPAPGEAAQPADVAMDLKNAVADAAELRRQLTLMEEHARGEVWRWQGDGTDSLEAMGNRMGVLIFASDLRALLDAAKAQPADVARLVEADAERYRYLRSLPWWAEPEIGIELDGSAWRVTFSSPAPFENASGGSWLDAAIDAARKEADRG